MGAELQNECMICGKLVDQAKGIHLLQHFICNECEKEIITTDTGDEQYHFFVERLQQLWQDLHLERITP